MTQHETDFQTIMGYIASGCGKGLSTEQTAVYFDLLGDLPIPVLQVAAKRALLEREWPTFPTVGELRALASEIQYGKPPTAEQAWMMAKEASQHYRPCDELPGPDGRVNMWGRWTRVAESLPIAVQMAGDSLGWRSIRDATNTEVARAQFVKAYSEFVLRQKKELLLPAPLQQEIRQIGNRSEIPNGSSQRERVTKLLKNIGSPE